MEFRVTEEQKQVIIEEAAAVEGRTVTDFSVATLVERAQDVILSDARFASALSSSRPSLPLWISRLGVLTVCAN